MRKEAACWAVLGCLILGVAPAQAAPSLLAQWPLDGTAADTSGHGLDGTLGLGSAQPTWITGVAGSALSFDGAYYVTVNDNPILEPAHVAVDAWVRRVGSPGNWRYVLSKGSVNCDRSAYGLYSGWSGGMAFYVSDANEDVISPEVPPSVVWDGAWHRVVGSYDGARVALWLDGAEVGSGTPATNLRIAYGTGSKGVRIGAYNGGCDLGFVGDIDDVRVWDDSPPAPPTTLPRIAPVPGTPSRVSVSSRGGSTPTSSPASKATSTRACLRMRLNPRTVKVKRKVRVKATVRRATKPASGVRVALSGAGVKAKARTNKLGTATITVKARKRGRLTVRVVGQKPSCPTATVRAK
jgi:hypothetical protein